MPEYVIGIAFLVAVLVVVTIALDNASRARAEDSARMSESFVPCGARDSRLGVTNPDECL